MSREVLMRLMTFTLLALATAAPAAAQPFSPLDPRALEELRAAAGRAHSDAVVILRDGKAEAEWYFGRERRPIELMSVMKSILGLGIGRLITEGRITSLDQPVHAFYPEWQQGQKRQITIRHLLNHTSGLQDVPNAGAEIYPSPDAVKLALAAEISEAPGTRFRYNNKATNLLAGVIERASGQRMDQFFVDEFFGPLGIDEYKWYFDRSGTPHGMAGLELHARDLAKFGQLVLDGGVWEGTRLVSEAFISEMLAQSQPHYAPYGLLWWRLPSEARFMLDEARLAALETAGASRADLDALRPLAGRVLTSRADRDAALASVFGDGWRAAEARFAGSGVDPIFTREYGEIVAYYGDGYLGQTLMILPRERIVAVRQVRRSDTYDDATDGFDTFKTLVLRALPGAAAGKGPK